MPVKVPVCKREPACTSRKGHLCKSVLLVHLCKSVCLQSVHKCTSLQSFGQTRAGEQSFGQQGFGQTRARHCKALGKHVLETAHANSRVTKTQLMAVSALLMHNCVLNHKCLNWHAWANEAQPLRLPAHGSYSCPPMLASRAACICPFHAYSICPHACSIRDMHPPSPCLLHTQHASARELGNHICPPTPSYILQAQFPHTSPMRLHLGQCKADPLHHHQLLQLI